MVRDARATILLSQYEVRVAGECRDTDNVHVTYNYHTLSAFPNRVRGARRIDIAMYLVENERKTRARMVTHHRL